MRSDVGVHLGVRNPSGFARFVRAAVVDAKHGTESSCEAVDLIKYVASYGQILGHDLICRRKLEASVNLVEPEIADVGDSGDVCVNELPVGGHNLGDEIVREPVAGA